GGARIAEAADRGIDDAPIALAQRLVGEAETIHHAGAGVLDYHLCRFDQLEKNLAAARLLEIEADRELVAVDALEIAGERPQLVIGMKRPDLARAVAVERLDLDDLGALVGEHHGAERSGQHLREIDDAQAVERSARRGSGRAHLSAQWLRRLISTW